MGTPGYIGGAGISNVPLGNGRYGGATPSPGFGIGMEPVGGKPVTEPPGGLGMGMGGGEVCSGPCSGVRMRSGGGTGTAAGMG